jgi:hypothetical protein
MKKEDIEFLKELQCEMLTQDTVCQASPRFWVVMDTVKDYWVDDNIDGVFVYSCNEGDAVFEGKFEELVDWIKELDGVSECTYNFSIDFIWNDEEYSIDDEKDLQNFLDEYDDDNYQVGNYRYREQIVENTMFLTLRECKEHIQINKHHYSDKAHSYAMTAWRSPQVARLYKILENTDWDEFNSEVEKMDKIEKSQKTNKNITMKIVSREEMPRKEIK